MVATSAATGKKAISAPHKPKQRNVFVAAMATVVVLALFLANPTRIEQPESHQNQKDVKMESGSAEAAAIDDPGPSVNMENDIKESAAINLSGPATETITDAEENPPLKPATEATPRPKNLRVYSKSSSIPPDPVHPPVAPEVQKTLADKWGKWKFWDGDEVSRPSEDYCAEYPNRDIPGKMFPEGAWQTDAVFVNHYLDATEKLIKRTKEAIFTEYGRGKPLPDSELGKRKQMFHWEMLDLNSVTEPPDQFKKQGKRAMGGWTTQRSHEGLMRRLLHAMLTNDSFTVVVGGDSAAGGKGNHFRQSYIMQFHSIMAPVFARLGVRLITRNMAQGGIGTAHSSIGSGSLYGDEVDLLIWDSRNTERSHPEQVDLFLRQGLIGGNRVPVLWGGLFGLLRMLHQNADADVGAFGTGLNGIPQVTSAEQAKSIPWAARYLNCSKASEKVCRDAPRFCSTCWIDRSDGVKPEVTQKMTGRVSGHPGWREHQLVGRVLAFSMLDALESAIVLWGERTMSGQPLDESFWHVTDYYSNIRKKVQNLDKSLGDCYKIENSLPSRICNTPMKARTQYTPRANFNESSLTSIIKPASNGYVPRNEKVALYEGPDDPNKCFHIPEDAPDVLAITIGRRRLEGFTSPQILTTAFSHSRRNAPKSRFGNHGRRLSEKVLPGNGWQVFGEPQGLCDGTYYAVCGRSADNDCILAGHPDSRGAIIGNEYAGWLVMDVKEVASGIIILNLHTWHFESEQTRTAGWSTVNNEASSRLLKPTNESLSRTERISKARNYTTPSLPDGFVFEYAIDGVIHNLDKEKFLEKKKDIRQVEAITLMDDPDFAKDGVRDVEVAVRLTGCGRQCTFGISHIYWA